MASTARASRWLLLGVFLVGVTRSPTVDALESAPAEATSDHRIQQLERRVAELEGRLQQALGLLAERPAPRVAAPPPTAAPVALPSDAADRTREALLQAEVQAAAERRRAEMATGSPLLRPGEWELEPSLTYGFTSNSRLSIEGFSLLPFFVAGLIRSGSVERDLVSAGFAASYGLSGRYQLEGELPYRYRSDDLALNDGEAKRASGSGLGDLRLGFSMHLNPKAIAGSTTWLARGNLFVPTGKDPFDHDPENPRDDTLPFGSGFWSVSADVTAIRPSDPVVLFASAGLRYTHGREVSGDYLSGDLSPGLAFDYSLGLALQLNYRTSLSFQLQHSITDETSLDGTDIPGSRINDARFGIGASWSLSPRRSLSVSIAAGLTEDAPDFLLRVSMPMKFGGKG
ncbi:MAG: transporter [Acidobacteriota bacterium]